MRLYLNGPLQEELSAPDAILLLAHYASGARAKVLRYRLTRRSPDEADYKFLAEDGDLVIDRRIAEKATAEAARAAKTEDVARARKRREARTRKCSVPSRWSAGWTASEERRKASRG